MRSGPRISVPSLLYLVVTPVAAASLANDILNYDYLSLGWAVLMSLLGGALRTIFTLATDTRMVRSFGLETFKDAVVAAIAGVLAYVVLEAARGFRVIDLPSEARLAALIFAGWSRLLFFGWLDKLGGRVAQAVNSRVSSAVGVDSVDESVAPHTAPAAKLKAQINSSTTNDTGV